MRKIIFTGYLTNIIELYIRFANLYGCMVIWYGSEVPGMKLWWVLLLFPERKCNVYDHCLISCLNFLIDIEFKHIKAHQIWPPQAIMLF